MVAVRSVVRAAALRIPPIRRVYQTMQFAAAEASAARARIVELDTRIANSVAETHAAVATVNAARAEEIDVLRVLLEAAERERDLLAARLAEVRARAAFAETRMSEGIDTTLAEIKRLGARFANLTAALPIAAVPHSNKTAAVQLYLDLIEAALTGVLVEDPSMAPWTETSFDQIRRELGRDWPARAQTMIGTARMRNLRILCERALAEGTPGDFIETGVWRGGACILMRGILQAYGDAERRVFVADSFCGLPPPDPSRYPADAGDRHNTYQQLAVSRAEVEENFRRYGLLDDRVIFLEGWFKDTLPAAPIERLAVLRLDGDMYESTIQALDALYHKVSPGGFVIIDDYVLKPCAKAVDHFRATRGVTAPLHNIDDAAVWWQVAR
ncbi:MAG: TylF/MycF/NovP-related O-methyltransferase [Stellaceae bacterium]